MISVDVSDGQRLEQNVPLAGLGGNKNGSNGSNGNGGDHRPPLAWIDVSNPDENDWQALAQTFGFHPLAIEDARKQNQRAKIDPYEGYLFLTLRAWAGTKSLTDDLTDATDEIDVFLGPSYLVTVHTGECGAVTTTRRHWERHPLAIHEAQKSSGYLLYLLLDAVVDEFFPAMDRLDQEIDTLEAAIYTPGALIDLAPAVALKKRLLLLRQTVTPMRDVINQLLRENDARLVPPALRPYFQDVYDHALRLVEQVDLHRDILGGVVDAMMAQVNNRLNQVMKTLTGISTILMSAALIAGIYGMNFDNMPELHTRYGYFGALAAMACVSIGLAVYFRRIKWF